MNKKLATIVLFIGLTITIVACAPGTGFGTGLGPAPEPPAATSAPATIAPVPTTAPAPTDRPAPTAIPPTAVSSAATSCLTVQQFQAMWMASTPAQGPGPLIQKLNEAWDAKGISRDLSAIGTGWLKGPYTVQPMSLVWTDLLGQSPTVPPGTGKWVPLRTQGGWGVFAAYDTVVVPTPGRSAKMCSSLDPENHLSGWR